MSGRHRLVILAVVGVVATLLTVAWLRAGDDDLLEHSTHLGPETQETPPASPGTANLAPRMGKHRANDAEVPPLEVGDVRSDQTQEADISDISHLYGQLAANPSERTAEALGNLLEYTFLCRHLPRSTRAFYQHEHAHRRRLTRNQLPEQEDGIRRHLRLIGGCANYTPTMLEDALSWTAELGDTGDLDAQVFYLHAAGPADWSWQMDPDKLEEFGARVRRYYDGATEHPVSPDAFALLGQIHMMGYVEQRDPVLGYAYRFAELAYRGEPNDEARSAAIRRLSVGELEAAELLAQDLLSECCE